MVIGRGRGTMGRWDRFRWQSCGDGGEAMEDVDGVCAMSIDRGLNGSYPSGLY